MITKNLASPFLKRGVLLALFIGSSLLGCGGGSANSTVEPVKLEPEAAYLTWLRGAAVPLTSVDPKAPDTELAFLDAKIGNASIIGLGEATHSSSEFQKMNHRILRYLVEHKGVTAFGIETQIGESRALDRYIISGEGDPKKLLANGFSMYYTQEMLDLVQWMRAYNLDVAHTKKLRFFGFDMQYVQGSIDQILSDVQSVDASAAPEMARLYSAFKKFNYSGSTEDYFTTSSAFQIQTRADLVQAYQWLEEHRQAFIAIKGEEAYAWALQLAKVVLQNETLQRVNLNIEANFAEGQTVRDTAMADNIDWFKQQYAVDGKITVYAHHAHINKGKYASAIDMGNTLSARHKLDYFSLGYVFYSGSINAEYKGVFKAYTSAPATVGSYDESFAKAGLNIAFLDMRNLSSTEAGPIWLNTQHLLREHGALWEPTPGFDETLTILPKRFDAVIFIKNINAAKLL